MDISFILWCFKKVIKCQIISKKISPPLTLMFILYAFSGAPAPLVLSTTNWHLPRAFARNWATAAWAFAASLCCCSCRLSTLPAGVSGWRVRHSVLQGNWWNRSLDTDTFRTGFHAPSPCISSLISRKALNPFMVTWLLMTSRKPFVKQVLDCPELPLHQNLIYWPYPTASLEQCLRAIWGAIFRAAILIWPQIKCNSQLSHCASF